MVQNNINAAVRAIYERIDALLAAKQRVIVAIDGRCAAGKTTLAGALAAQYDGCAILHMDDFFLRPEQRTAERLAQPGENVDHERFLQQVLVPLSKGESFYYRPYDCFTAKLGEAVNVDVQRVAVVEGSYSCHPKLAEYYDLRIFLNVDSQEQMIRIIKRNGAQAAKRFEELWIPLEEKYFAAFDIAAKCHMKFDT